MNRMLYLCLGVALLSGQVLSRAIRLAPVVLGAEGESIPNEYIVMLRPTASAASDSEANHVEEHLQRMFGQQLLQESHLIHRYESGYAAVFSHSALETLRQQVEVDYIEQNQVVWAMDRQESPANWGLDRICHRDLPLQGEYLFNPEAGRGVDVYVVDTGVNVEHDDFEGRALWGLTAPQGDEDADGHGHGTHVASTIAGRQYGVAKSANIIAVKVLRSNGYGTTADVLRGIEWTAQEHQRKRQTKDAAVKSVGNMSLGGGKSVALDTAVEKAIANGVLFAVAAGNDNRDACRYSPAGADGAITVSATDSQDRRTWFSNWGECVDVFAPGMDITAAWIGSRTAVRTISGTSMAAPHVAGVMAVVASTGEWTPRELKDKVLSMATADKVTNPGRKSPNKLLFLDPELSQPLQGAADAIVDSLRFQLGSS